MEGLLRTLELYLAPLRRRVSMMVARGVIRLINDDTGVQGVQIEVLAGEVVDDAERFQDYGFTSVPLPGAEGVAVFVGGNRDHGLVIKIDDRRYRLKALQPGEVAMYTDEGDKIHIKRGGTIAVQAATEVEVTAPLASFSGNVTVDGTLVVDGVDFGTHVHDENGTGGGTTDGPRNP